MIIKYIQTKPHISCSMIKKQSTTKSNKIYVRNVRIQHNAWYSMDVSYNHFTINLFQKPPLSLNVFFVVVVVVVAVLIARLRVLCFPSQISDNDYDLLQIQTSSTAIINIRRFQCWLLIRNNIYDYITHMYASIRYYILQYI